ncbi:MAG: cell division topological specificity factor MinE [Candidatus Gastranaerophilales bacterium]|nr:cell division topological specificity factor MinE [Candidatus Gastranaerophilales bacterium]
MKTLFSDIYNKIIELFQFEKSENTGECAANRLQVILMHDRTKLDPLIMNKMREELIDIFSKYVVIDKEELEIGLKQEGDTAALMLNIPIIRAKTEEELEELRKKLQEEEQKVSDDDENLEDIEENSDEEEIKDDSAVCTELSDDEGTEHSITSYEIVKEEIQNNSENNEEITKSDDEKTIEAEQKNSMSD